LAGCQFNASISGPEAVSGEVGDPPPAMFCRGSCHVMADAPAQSKRRLKSAGLIWALDLRTPCASVQVRASNATGLGADSRLMSAASMALRGDGTHLVPLDA